MITDMTIGRTALALGVDLDRGGAGLAVFFARTPALGAVLAGATAAASTDQGPREVPSDRPGIAPRSRQEIGGVDPVVRDRALEHFPGISLPVGQQIHGRAV